MLEPPLLAGAVHETVDAVTPFGVPETLVGAPGTVEGTALAEIEEYGPVPTALTAATRK
jgi:hypothetical protein